MNDFEKRTKREFAFALDWLKNNNSMRPVFVVESAAEMLVIPSGWSDLGQKHECIVMLRLVCAAYDAIAVSMLTESWMRPVEQKAGESRAETLARIAQTDGKDDPDRVETVMFADAAREDGKVVTRFALRKVLRGEAGTVIDLRPVDEMPDGEEPDGWLGSVLSARPVPDHLRVASRALVDSLGARFETRPS